MVAKDIVLIAIVEVLLRLFGLNRTWRAMMWVGFPIRRHDTETEIVKTRLAVIRRARSKCPTFGKCLARSLVLWWQLYRRDITSTVVVGVRTTVNFRAHAWVEHQGRQLNAGKRVNEVYNDIARFDTPGDMK